jgi:hypothetical protein
MNLLRMSGAALAAAIAVSADAAEQKCDRYAAYERLPNRFEEIASADLVGGAEIFVYTDLWCTCDNTPSVDRKRGKPVPQGLNWSCHEATPDERGAH